MSTYRWGAATDCGRVRLSNEDSYVASSPVFVIADGMGGHLAGEVASGIVINEFAKLIGDETLSATDALKCIDEANSAILTSAGLDDTRSGMGTTVTGLVLVIAAGSEHWMVFNVGDSRVYRLDGSYLRQITTDHSEVEEMVAAGTITREQARYDRRRSIITRSLGTYPAPVAESWVFPISTQDRFIICSDGLTTELLDSEIEELANAIVDPQNLAKELVAHALSAGGRDNVTVIVVDRNDSLDVSEVDVKTAPNSEGILGD